jgi:hypothetical protein
VALDLDLPPWRSLFGRLLDYRGDAWGDEVLMPWVAEHPKLVDELHEIGMPENHRVPVERGSRGHSVLWELYALGRVLDVLISPFQPVNDDPDILDWTQDPPGPWWTGRIPSAEAYVPFMEALGCTRAAEDRFHPFFHEIVAVEPAGDPGHRPELVDEVWPGYLVGSMLLVRAGVTVRAGTEFLEPVIAGRSALYWSWWRRNRRVVDCSHGWGSNSQWGTDFRRDYVVGDELHYNVDRHPAEADHRRERTLTPEQSRSLVRFRCSTTVDLGPEQWPFYEHPVEPRG